MPATRRVYALTDGSSEWLTTCRNPHRSGDHVAGANRGMRLSHRREGMAGQADERSGWPEAPDSGPSCSLITSADGARRRAPELERAVARLAPSELPRPQSSRGGLVD